VAVRSKTIIIAPVDGDYVFVFRSDHEPERAAYICIQSNMGRWLRNTTDRRVSSDGLLEKREKSAKPVELLAAVKHFRTSVSAGVVGMISAYACNVYG